MTEGRPPPIPRSVADGNAADTELEVIRAEASELRQNLITSSQQAHKQADLTALASQELQHRARNAMALIRSAFRRTVATGGSLDEVEMHFCGRLDVIAHYMLPHSGKWDATVDVQDVIRDELRSFAFGESPGITIAGPDAAISIEQAQSFALAIHELATNALKFGALSVPQATLSVTWELHDRRLKLIWAETGVPLVTAAPVHKGFGQEFIEEALSYQTGAITHFERKPGGIFCTIEIELGLRARGQPLN